MPIMRSTHTLTATLPCSGLWNNDVRAMMDPDHRLILRWCRHLELEDVLRIDCGSIDAALNDPARSLGDWRIAFGDGPLPVTIVPWRLVKSTNRYIQERSRVSSSTPASEVAVFDESYGEPVTRATLSASIRRAMALVRLSQLYFDNESVGRW
jgi:hypothetical protein